MALMVACLNHQCRDKSAYFALLNTPDMDIETFPASDVDGCSCFTDTSTMFGRSRAMERTGCNMNVGAESNTPPRD